MKLPSSVLRLSESNMGDDMDSQKYTLIRKATLNNKKK